MSVGKITEILGQTQEGLTKYQGVISSDHAYIHQGKGFTYVFYAAALNGTTRIGFTTPSVASGKFVHWRPIGGYTSSDAITVELTEGDTFTGGSDAVPFNRNRNIATTSVMQAFKTGVTSTPSGLLVLGTGAGSASGPGAGSSEGGENEELVLKQNEDYVLTITSGGATRVFLQLFWYEEDGFQG
jgi:hypothetical protein